MGRSKRYKRASRRVVCCLTLALLSCGAVASQSSAAIGPEIFSFGDFGSGAGQLKSEGGGVVADPDSGHLFISDRYNSRISEFSAWGEFIETWGFGVATGASEFQTCTALCQEGKSGSAAGQLDTPNGIAMAADGNLYVFERENRRVQVFDQAGNFVLMFGGGVNETTGGDICTKASGDACGPGSTGTEPGEFGMGFLGTGRDYIDIGPDNLVYVGDKDRIQKFELNGTYVGSLPLPEAGDVGALAVDPVSGDVYFAYRVNFAPAKAFRINETTGAVIYELPTTAVEGIAVGPDGTVYVTDDPVPTVNTNPTNNPLLREFDSTGELVESCCVSVIGNDDEVFLPAIALNEVTEAGDIDLYVIHAVFGSQISFVEVRGPAPTKWPPPSVAPTIEGQFASQVGEEEATLKGVINPNFWDDTEYWVEYGPAPCSGGGCTETPKTLLGAGTVKKPITTAGVELSGLTPGTTYHYRFVAESDGGGPTFGPDATFTTPVPPPDPELCPANEVFRTGLSANLWECRAYEMVSPIDKFGGEIFVLGNLNGTPSRLDQATPEGEKITYSSYRSFGDAESAAFTTQYLASREAGKEWSTHAISPPREGRVFTGVRVLESPYKAFLEDLSSGWFVFDTEPILATGGVPGYPNIYRRDNTAETYEAISDSKPTATAAADYNLEVQGTPSAKQTVFRAKGRLTGTASTAPEIYQTYESINGTLRLVSVRPAGTPAPVDSTVGAKDVGLNNNREANVENAVSEDGSRIYWSEMGGLGRLYVRVGGTQTFQVSAGAATFWDAKPDGSEALYTEAGKLQLFDFASKTSSTLVSEGVTGVMGASEDLNRIYFVSSADLAEGAEDGARNLYLYEEGQGLELVAVLSEKDFKPIVPSPISLSPRKRYARVGADGATAIFASRGALTGEDNIDQETGEEDAEVFRYEAEDDELLCISCLGNGARPVGRNLRFDSVPSDYYYASLIPGWEMQLHAPRVLSDDGNRVYFNSLNALVPQDTNGMQDVYEWEAPGRGQCTEAAPNYRAASGGCVNLISTGTDTRDSEFIDASSDGRDVFFTTGQSLVDQDPGQWDLYDAREGGGLPTPPLPGPECEGEAGCLPPATPAPAPPPVGESPGQKGGNVVEPPTKRKPCRKGFKRNKAGKCVKKKKHKKQRKHKAARANQGANR